MKAFRFSIANVALAMIVVAVACTAIGKNDKLWSWLLELVSVTLLLAALLFTFYHRGAKPFWVGYLVFSVGLIVLRFVPDYNLMRSPNSALWDFFPGDLYSYADSPVSTAWMIFYGALGGVIAVFIRGDKLPNGP